MKGKDQNGNNGVEAQKGTKAEGGPDVPPVKRKGSRDGKHPAFAVHQFKPGQSGNPAGRPPGIPNLNDLLITAVKKFRGRAPRGKKRRQRFFEELIEQAIKKKPRLLEHLLDKILADATPAAGAQVNVNSQVTNEHSLHQVLLADPRVRGAALDLEQRMADCLNDTGGNGARK